MEDLEGYICPVQRFSVINTSSSDCSIRDKGCTLDVLDSIPGTSLMVWSHLQWSRSVSKSF